MIELRREKSNNCPPILLVQDFRLALCSIHVWSSGCIRRQIFIYSNRSRLLSSTEHKTYSHCTDLFSVECELQFMVLTSTMYEKCVGDRIQEWKTETTYCMSLLRCCWNSFPPNLTCEAVLWNCLTTHTVQLIALLEKGVMDIKLLYEWPLKMVVSPQAIEVSKYW